jgi:hypothetical protein
LEDRKLVCKHCGSKYQQIFNAELTATYRGIKNLSATPVYLCKEDTLICMDCGNIELKVSGAELEQLREGLAAA